MASAKKLPHSRRCKNPEKLGLYDCRCDEEEDNGLILSERHVPSSRDLPDDSTWRRSRSRSDEFRKRDEKRVISVSEADVSIIPERQTSRLIEGPPFDFLDILVGTASIILFYFDIVTDILLAKDYYQAKDYLAFGLTAAFTAGPCLVTLGLNFRWYWLDYVTQRIQVQNRGKDNVRVTSRALWALRFIMTFLMMGPVMRQLEYLYNGIKSNSNSLSPKEKRRHYQVMRMEDVDACCIRMFECFLEAAPQLVLQIYILLSHKAEQEMITEVIRAAAILSSWISLSWSMVSYQKALRFSHEDKENMTIPGQMFYFLWRACEIGPRVIALGVFAAYFEYIVFIVVGVHWLAMSSWLFCQKTRFYENRCEERVFNIVCGYVLIFSFLNVRDGRTRYRMLVFYIILYLENIIMVGFWFYFTPDKGYWFYLPVFFTIVTAVCLQITFQFIYYGCFHPLGYGKIPCCLERGEYSCYESLCHDLETEDNQYYVQKGPVPAAV